MKKKMFSVILCIVLGLSSGLLGCGVVSTVNNQIDKTRTQIYVGVYDAGVGTEFIESAKQKFEQKYKDESFEPGKKGVEVRIDSQRQYAGSTLGSIIKSNTNEIFFTESVDYYSLLAQNALVDISDIVTEKLTDFGETRSIEDKMYDEHKSYFKSAASGNKYYAVPFYESYTGIIYDKELFNDNYFYIGADGKSYVNAEGMTLEGENVGLSAGPDNDISTTFDNGIAATYDEFFTLCDHIADCGVIPFIWSGQFQYYANWVGTNLWADYEGKKNMSANFQVKGKVDDLVQSVNGDGTLTFMPETEIKEDNYYLLGRQAGRYYAVDFLRRVVRSGHYDSTYCFSPSTSQSSAQQEFLYSNRSMSKTPIAMMFEGSWWENEATPTFNLMSQTLKNSGKKDRQFGFMPFPKATPEKADQKQKQTLLAVGEAAAFISANTKPEKLELVKLFLQFCRTD